jgi:DNA-binding MarR family transcriptional regulator
VKRSAATAVGFLLSQVGAHANLRFAAALAPTGLSPAQAGTLWAVADAEGVSQQALAARLGSHPSRIVALVDELEARGLVERRANESDRRTYALHLTRPGRDQMRTLVRVAREHESSMCSALSERERTQLGELLGRIAAAEGLMPGVHPGFRATK